MTAFTTSSELANTPYTTPKKFAYFCRKVAPTPLSIKDDTGIQEYRRNDERALSGAASLGRFRPEHGRAVICVAVG